MLRKVRDYMVRHQSAEAVGVALVAFGSILGVFFGAFVIGEILITFMPSRLAVPLVILIVAGSMVPVGIFLVRGTMMK